MHGGDIYRNKIHMDFSVNVNPLGIPAGVMKALEKGIYNATVYPDAMCEKLKEVIAEHFSLKPDNVVCGNGASELLLALAHWKNPGKALLPAPGFSGYRKVLKTVGCTEEFFTLSEGEDFAWTDEKVQMFRNKLENERYDIVFVTNPSNPTGRLIEKEDLCDIASICERVGTLLVIDECFMELTSDPERYSMVKELDSFKSVCILRAFTKSFAIPGIRLGYLLCPDQEMAKNIEEQLPEWNVSVPAQLAGVAAIREKDHLIKSREMIAQEREYLEKELVRLGGRVVPSEANFILFYWRSHELYQELLQKGILIRDCSDYEGLQQGFYRIAVKKHEENQALILEIESTIHLENTERN